MGALGFALPLSGFLYMLSKPTEIRDPQEVVSAIDQLNNLPLNVPTEIYRDSDENNESETQFPFLSLRPIQTANRDVSDDISFELSKADSTHPSDASSITNIQLDNHAKWLQGSDEYRASKELVIEQDKNPPTEANQKDTSIRMFVSNVKNALKENIMKRNMQLGSDIATRRNMDRSDASNIANRTQRKVSYIRLCKKVTGSALRNDAKDCMLLPRNEFYVERLLKQMEADQRGDTINVLERIETQTNDEKYNDKDYNNGKHRPKDGAKPFVVSISNDSGVQLVNKLASMQVTTKTRR